MIEVNYWIIEDEIEIVEFTWTQAPLTVQWKESSPHFSFWPTITIIKMITIMIKMITKMALYCPQGSGTLRQQLLMMHWLCTILHYLAKSQNWRYRPKRLNKSWKLAIIQRRGWSSTSGRAGGGYPPETDNYQNQNKIKKLRYAPPQSHAI